jgi:CheY-like chemotaxis protein
LYPRVLIVEDEPDTVALLRFIFGREAIAVETATDIEQAFQKIESGTRFDLAILDVDLPDGDGREVCRWMRQLPQLREIPVVVVSGYALEADRLASLEAGADAHIAKPFSPRRLLDQVRQLIPA